MKNGGKKTGYLDSRVSFLLTSVFCLLTPASSEAATKIFLKDAASALGAQVATGYGGYGCNDYSGAHVLRLANTTQGSSTVTVTQVPSVTAPPCQRGSESGTTYLRFVTPPITSGFTLSGNIDYSIGCRESATQTNAGVRMVVYRYSKAAGGIVSTIHTSADSTTECPTTAGLRTIAAAAPTSTAMATGDRIVFVVETQTVGGTWGGNNSRTVDFLYDGAAAGTGDSFANFADTFSFDADTNDGRVILALRDALRRMLAVMLPLDFTRPRPAKRIR